MKNSKKIVLVALLLTFALALSLLTACGPKATLVSIDLEQTTYVVGQELKGSVKVDVKGEEQTWAFNQEGLSITGYNPNTVGKQTVTATYGEQTLTKDVTVVPRVVANDIKTDYIEGDKFDTTQGSLTFTRDNGTSFSVFFDDVNLTLTGFSSQEEALPLTITATYVEGSTTYTGEFTVNVYGVESVSLSHTGAKKDYLSHDAGLSLTGAFLTVTTSLGQEYVQVTPDMCSGFDLSVVSQENPTATQTITVTYAGKSKTFKITITYSDVSFIRDNVAELRKIDWSGEEMPTLTEEQGALVKLCTEKYFGLIDAHKAMISPEDSYVVMRNAARYLFGLYIDQWTLYEEAFSLSSYQAVKDAYNALSVETAPLRTYGRLLEQISAEFGGQELFNGVNIQSYLASLVTEEQFASNLAIFNFMLDLYETMTVPTSWEAANLANYSQQLDSIVLKINSSNYRASTCAESNQYRSLYSKLANWRADFFDILYTYYYSVQDYTTMLSLVPVQLPGEMENLYTYLVSAFFEAADMQNGKIIDSSMFMYFYSKAYDIAQSVTKGNNDLYKFIYANSKLTGFLVDGNGKDANLPFAGLLYYVTVTDVMQYGWYKHQGIMIGNEQFDDMWDKYLTVLNALVDTEYAKSEQFATDIKAMFNAFAALAPNIQYEFIRSVNVFYNNEKPFPEFALDVTGGEDGAATVYTYFTYFIVQGFTTVVSPEEMAVLEKLLVAIEARALYNHRDNMTTKFVDTMQLVVDGFGALTEEQKASFTANFGTAYSRYEQMWKIETKQVDDSEANFGDYQLIVYQVISCLNDLVNLENQISNKEIDASRCVVRFLSAFEYAETLVNYLVNNAPQEIVDEYYHHPYITINAQTGAKTTIEFMMYYVRASYSSLLKNIAVDNNTRLVQVYFELELQDFFVKAYPIYWYSEGGVLTSTYVDSVLEAMDAFRKLPTYEKYLVLALDANNDYHGNITKMAQQLLNTECLPVAEKLLNLENMHIGYLIGNTEVTKQNVIDLFEEIKTMKNALQGTSVTNFDSFLKGMYEYYEGEVAKLKQAN